jgi:hypothetical protein
VYSGGDTHFPNAFFANFNFMKVSILLQCNYFVAKFHIIIIRNIRIYYFVCISFNLFQTKIGGLPVLICCMVSHYGL